MGGRIAAAVAALILATAPVTALGQAEDPPTPEVVRADVVEVRPSDGSAIVYDGRRYGGGMRITGHSAGLALVETIDLGGYLAGIQEVPFSWQPAALQAQAIAARTYLAWTLARGRTASGRAYDYDICATDACQVYAGLEPRLAESGEKWLDAVRSTESQILLYRGEPAQAYYSSTSGGRTRTVSDIWPDIDLPYLKAVESPGEDSPFAAWRWWLTEDVMEAVMTEAGLASGDLMDVRTTVRADGEGPWTVTVISEDGERTVSTWELRGLLNQAGPAAAPALLPAVRPDGERYPSTILSPSFTISSTRLPVPAGGLRPLTLYEIEGAGWGHLVGMSQYGAQAMAEAGSRPGDILAHYYGGLRPTESPQLVPDSVEVALALGAPEMGLRSTGPVTVSVDGRRVATDELGTWKMVADRGSIEVTSPVGLGFPPELRPGLIGFDGLRPTLRPELTAAAEVEWHVFVGDREVASFGPRALDAGLFNVPIPLAPQPVRITIAATNRHGGDSLTYETGDAGEGSATD